MAHRRLTSSGVGLSSELAQTSSAGSSSSWPRKTALFCSLLGKRRKRRQRLRFTVELRLRLAAGEGIVAAAEREGCAYRISATLARGETNEVYGRFGPTGKWIDTSPKVSPALVQGPGLVLVEKSARY